jgi:hypothetical protein
MAHRFTRCEGRYRMRGAADQQSRNAITRIEQAWVNTVHWMKSHYKSRMPRLPPSALRQQSFCVYKTRSRTVSSLDSSPFCLSRLRLHYKQIPVPNDHALHALCARKQHKEAPAKQVAARPSLNFGSSRSASSGGCHYVQKMENSTPPWSSSNIYMPDRSNGKSVGKGRRGTPVRGAINSTRVLVVAWMGKCRIETQKKK